MRSVTLNLRISKCRPGGSSPCVTTRASKICCSAWASPRRPGTASISPAPVSDTPETSSRPDAAGFLPMPRPGIILAPPEIQHRGLSMKPAMKWTFAICAAVAWLAGASLAQDKPAMTKPASAKPPARPRPAAKSAATASPLSAPMNVVFATKTFEQAAISPDGKKVAWVETLIGKNGAPSGNTAIYWAEAKAGAAPHRITAGGAADYAEGGVAWSPDGRRIAFLSDAAKRGQQQLYVADALGGASRKLTSVKGFLAAPSWSPDGKNIALLFTENATRCSCRPATSL